METTEKPVVLFVDDDSELREFATHNFKEVHGHPFISASTFDEGVRAIHDTAGYMVAFIDIHLKGGKSGFELLRYIQDTASHRVVAYAFTGETSLIVEAKALKAGAINVFHKSVDSMDRLVVYTEESFVLRLLKEGAEDDLTGLNHFHSFRQAVIAELKSARDRHDRKHPAAFSLLFADADRFKRINDTHGHLTGDMVLKRIASVLRSHVRPTDHLCRKGGDEFLIWLPDSDKRNARTTATKLQEAVARELIETPRAEPLHISISVGSSTVYRDDIEDDPEATLSRMIGEANRRELEKKGALKDAGRR